ncbi:MAG: preprotein translocase subunit SecG [Eubacteriales bacterium]|jgi:preprotein translocase subunit SecG
MTTMQIVFGVIHILVCLFLIVVIMLQEGKNPGLSGSVGGGATNETFFDRNRGNTLEAKLKMLTKLAAVLFVVLTIALVFVF